MTDSLSATTLTRPHTGAEVGAGGGAWVGRDLETSTNAAVGEEVDEIQVGRVTDM